MFLKSVLWDSLVVHFKHCVSIFFLKKKGKVSVVKTNNKTCLQDASVLRDFISTYSGIRLKSLPDLIPANSEDLDFIHNVCFSGLFIAWGKAHASC